jgi:intracellular septation protein
MKQPLKSITEFGPLLAFFLAYKYAGIVYATGALLIATLIAVGITYYTMKKIPFVPLISAAVVSFFGMLTIISGDEMFIKIKPTLINLLFAGILLVGAIRGKGFLKNVMGSAMEMSDAAWVKFSARWGIFFLALAAANEAVWRNFPTDIWVEFKVFGILAATFLFMMTQLPFIKKHTIDNEARKS